MTPSSKIRLSSVLRAMTDVISPAIMPGNALAREQAGLVIAHIRMLIDQVDFAGAYGALCANDMEACARQCAVETKGGRASRASADKILAVLNQLTDVEHHEARYNEIGFALEDLVTALRQDGDASSVAAVDKHILQFTARQSARERSWFAGTGLDADSDTLASIEEITAKKK